MRPGRAAASAACLLGAYCLCQAASGADNQEDRVTVLEEKLERSLKLIEKLNIRVQELESQLSNAKTAPPAARAEAAATVPAPASAAQTQTRLENVEQQLTQLADTNAARGGGGIGVPLHGFADVGIGNHTANQPGLKGANLGGLDIFLNPQLGEHTRSLFELVFEVSSQGQVQPDLERAQIGYQFSDAATIWVGRFHTPFGYYNTAFHHGQEIATSLRRPRFILFEDQGGVMPAHTVGAWLTGADHLPEGKLTYDVFFGNGQGISAGLVDPRSSGVANGGSTYGGNVGYVFGDMLHGLLSGLKVGVSAFRAHITDDRQIAGVTRVDNAGVYFAYDTDRFEHIGEYYRFKDRDLHGAGFGQRSSAGFLQLAWRLPFATPYVRYERAAFSQNDNYFSLQVDGMSYYRAAMGLRFDLDLRSALKFEFARTKNTDRVISSWTDAMLDYAIRF